MTAEVIPFPGQRVVRRPVDRLRVLLAGVHDYWSLREFSRTFNECQMLLDPLDRYAIVLEYRPLWKVYPAEATAPPSAPQKDLG